MASTGFSTGFNTGFSIGLHGNRHGIHPSVNFEIGRQRDYHVNDLKKQEDKTLSRLYGESDAVVQSARLKSCLFANGIILFAE